MKKLLTILLAVLMCFTLIACKKDSGEDPNNQSSTFDLENMNDIQTDVQKEFDALQKRWFKEDLESDYLNTHFSVEDPSAYGLKDLEVTLGEVESDEDDTTYSDRLAALAKYNVADLTPDQQIMYKCMLFYFQLMVDAEGIEEDYTFCFTPNSGLNNNLITNFTEFDIRNEQDARDLITLVQDSGRYIDECIQYTKDQAEKGIAQTDSVIDSIIEQCERFISKVDDNEVITVYNSRIDDMNLADGEQLKKEMATAVKNVLIPGYKRIISMYKGLYGKNTTNGRLAEYGEDGKKTYELIFRNKVSTSKSVGEMISEMQDVFDDVIKEIIGIRIGALTDDYGYTELEDILGHLQEEMVKDFPAPETLEYKVNYLDPSVVSDNVSAYYLLAPIDNIHNNVIKVNPTFVEQDINGLCITLAHEGFPGHLYQHTYYFGNHPNNEYRYGMTFLGYAEGWAMYVESNAYNYFLTSSKEVRYMQLNDMFSYYLYGLIDMQMHYNNWSKNKISRFLSNYLAEEYAEEYAEAIYDTNIGDPGMFLPYSVGMYQMITLYETAKEALGEEFDMIEYNKVILDTGEAPFDVVKERVDAYIAFKQGK